MTDAAQITHGANKPADWTEPDGDVDTKLDEIASRISWTLTSVKTEDFISSKREIVLIDPS